MPHRAETILEAIKTVVTGLTLTGQNVERDRVYPPENIPALSVDMGGESRGEIDTGDMTNINSQLEVGIRLLVKSNESTTVINSIKAEVYSAIMGSSRLGLNFVDYLVWREDTAPTLDGENETRTVSVIMNFEVGFFHSLLSKES